MVAIIGVVAVVGIGFDLYRTGCDVTLLFRDMTEDGMEGADHGIRSWFVTSPHIWGDWRFNDEKGNEM